MPWSIEASQEMDMEAKGFQAWKRLEKDGNELKYQMGECQDVSEALGER